MGLGLGIGVWWPTQTSIIPGLLKALCARATYCENKLCTTATLEEIAAVRYTAPVLPTGLLADYPGAAAAYSLRNLIDTTKNVVRVRRSSDNTEQNFSAAEITDGTLTTFTGANDGFVTVWYDQSGNSNNAVQVTATQQPKIVSSGSTLLRGGKPSMQFDGNDDYFNTSQNNPFTFTGGVSMIHASYKNANAYKLYETILSANGAASGTKVKMALGYSSASAVNPTPTIATDIWQPSGIQYDGTVGTNERQLIGFYISNWSTHRSTGLSNIRLNGSDLTTKPYSSVNPTALGTNPIKIGVFNESLGDSMFGGEIQEIIAYASDKNLDRVGIETNINDHYLIY